MYICDNISLNVSYNEKFVRQSFKENKNTHFMLNNVFPRKSFCLADNVEKYGRDGQATVDNIIWRVRFASW